MPKFTDKVVIVTGASAGIGRATAKAYAQSGAKVIVADIDKELGQATADDIKTNGGEATFLYCDVTQEQDVMDLVGNTLKTYGKLDIAFNNAGIEIENSKLADCPMSTFDNIMNVNVKGVWLCMKYQIPAMLSNGGGSIVNTASVAGLGAAPKMAAYSASKHAVIGLTKSAAVEYGKKGICINAVCPGVIDTEMFRRAHEGDPRKKEYVANIHPVGRIGKAEEVAAAVLYLSSDLSGFTSGVALPVDGGYTCI